MPKRYRVVEFAIPNDILIYIGTFLQFKHFQEFAGFKCISKRWYTCISKWVNFKWSRIPLHMMSSMKWQMFSGIVLHLYHESSPERLVGSQQIQRLKLRGPKSKCIDLSKFPNLGYLNTFVIPDVPITNKVTNVKFYLTTPAYSWNNFIIDDLFRFQKLSKLCIVYVNRSGAKLDLTMCKSLKILHLKSMLSEEHVMNMHENILFPKTLEKIIIHVKKRESQFREIYGIQVEIRKYCSRLDSKHRSFGINSNKI